MSSASPQKDRKIVIIGGGAIGCSVAYFLTHHEHFDSKAHSVTILETSDIAGGASGKAGGLLASWATPKCLAPLSFKTHAELAKKHGGDKAWGHRYVYAAEVELAIESNDHASNSKSTNGIHKTGPEELDWLLPGVLKTYDEIGTPHDTAQVSPYLYTTTIAKLAREAGAEIIKGRATSINYAEDGKRVQSVTYTSTSAGAETTHNVDATDIVVAAGPWTPALLPRVSLLTPRGHSVVVKPSSGLSNHVLFTSLSVTTEASFENLRSPEIYPRGADSVNDFETVYTSGLDDSAEPLPSSTENVKLDSARVEKILNALHAISEPIRDGEVLARQACYKPQIRPHDDEEEVGPMVGKYDDSVRGLWVATGHDEWGMQNSAGTGLLISEMVWEGRAKSADASFLEPRKWMKNESPYAVGNTLQLQLDNGKPLTATVLELFQPFTLSCVMVVQLDDPSLPGRYVLKLYDRRHATQLRDDHDFPWSTKVESEYQQFVHDGHAASFFELCASNINGDEHWAETQREKWTDAQHEAYLQCLCRKIYHAERRTYELLEDIQGEHVPELFTNLSLRTSDSASGGEYLDCPGLLLQYVSGYPLTNIALNAPREDWQEICEEAIHIACFVSNRGICNKDAKTRSFIVSHDGNTQQLKIFMTDFGFCVFRDQAKSDEEFRGWQADEDEEGAVGLAMEKRLKGGFRYRRSSWSETLLDEYKSEE